MAKESNPQAPRATGSFKKELENGNIADTRRELPGFSRSEPDKRPKKPKIFKKPWLQGVE
jgi:hypothetical protein